MAQNGGHGLEEHVSWEKNLLGPLREPFRGPFLAKNRKKWNNLSLY